MYKTLIIFATLFSISFSVQARTKEKLIKYVCNQLTIDLTGSATEDCIYDEEGGFPLSHFTVLSDPRWVADLDGDGEQDVLVRILDEGMGGGGNGFGFDFKVVLMKKGRIDRVLNILGGAKYSDAYLEVTAVKDRKIYATCTENPMSRRDITDDRLLRSADMVFEYKDGQMIEKRFANCPLAGMNRHIFSDESPFAVARTADMTDWYEPLQRETLHLDEAKTDNIHASLGGCKNMELRFNYDLPYEKSMTSNKSLAKQIYRNFVLLLKGYTRYTSVMNNLLEKLDTTSLETEDKYIMYMTLPLEKNWNAHLIMQSYLTLEGKSVELQLVLKKLDNEESTDFWDKMR